MLSKKMTFSLMSLITILALAFVAPSAMAHNPDVDDFHVKDVDRDTFDHRKVSVDGFNVVVRPNPEVAQYTLITAGGTLDPDVINIDLDVEFEHAVGVLDTDNNGAAATATTTADQITWIAFNSVGNQVGTGVNAGGILITDVGFGTGPNDYPFRTASKRRLRVALTPTAQVTPTANADRGEVTRIVIEFAQIPTIDPTITEADDISGSTAGTVDITVHQPTTQGSDPETADFDTPRVVSIQRLRPGSQTVVAAFQEAAVAGDFDVRIVLSELPAAFTLADHIKVTGGEAVVGSLVAGTPFLREGPVPLDIFAPLRAELLNTTRPHPIEGMYEHSLTTGGVPAGAFGSGPVPYPTGPDLKYQQYRVRISPYQPAATYDRPDPRVVITISAFHDGAAPYNNYYQPGVNAASTPNGREKLDLPIAPSLDPRDPGFELLLPDSEDAKIPANGFYLLVRNKQNSGIDWSQEVDRSDYRKVENVATKQTPVQLFYNVRASDMLPNLETFLVNNGTIELVAYGPSRGRQTTLNLGDIYISEVMWGSDAGLLDPRESQWIEIATSGPARDIGDSRLALHFYAAHETAPTAYVREETGALGRVIDRIGTKADDTGLHWSIAGKGQSGRTSVDPGTVTQLPIAERDQLISMYRVMVGAMVPGNGTMADTWMQATGPGVNFQLPVEGTLQGYHIGTPGAGEFDTPDETAEAATAAQATAAAAAASAAAEQTRIASTGTIPTNGQIYISEVMFAGGGRLPQWIEIANGSRSEEVNLSGWTITVDNAPADADVSVGATATFTIPADTKISPSAQDDTPSTILVVTEKGRNNLTGPLASGQVINLSEDNEVELILAGVVTGKYTLLSNMAFMVTLAPPEPPKTTPPTGETTVAKATRQAAEKTARARRVNATDKAGNLGTDGAAAWVLPMNEDGARSSIIRKHVQVSRGPTAPEGGMMMENWVLASDTSFAQVTHIRASSYYGSANDVGTPGFRAGGALPVELSHFSPARDKVTGAVVITWSTQSELNNAGFFIKRSQQADGEFKVINATMIAGAGTTSEKQFYTYNDTTAQPNVVYYYQIEDVSLDGNRQTLTRGIRLRGHVSVAGKLTTLWGDLKTSQ